MCPCDINVRAIRLALTHLMLGSRRGEGSVTTLHIPKSVSSSLHQRLVILTFTMCSFLHLYNVHTHVPSIPFSCLIQQFHLTFSFVLSFSHLTFPLVLSLFLPPPPPPSPLPPSPPPPPYLFSSSSSSSRGPKC